MTGRMLEERTEQLAQAVAKLETIRAYCDELDDPNATIPVEDLRAILNGATVTWTRLV